MGLYPTLENMHSLSNLGKKTSAVLEYPYGKRLEGFDDCIIGIAQKHL